MLAWLIVPRKEISRTKPGIPVEAYSKVGEFSAVVLTWSGGIKEFLFLIVLKSYLYHLMTKYSGVWQRTCHRLLRNILSKRYSPFPTVDELGSSTQLMSLPQKTDWACLSPCKPLPQRRAREVPVCLVWAAANRWRHKSKSTESLLIYFPLGHKWVLQLGPLEIFSVLKTRAPERNPGRGLETVMRHCASCPV